MNNNKLFSMLYAAGVVVVLTFASLHFVYEIQKGPVTSTPIQGPQPQAQKVNSDLTLFESIFETNVETPGASWAEKIFKIVAHIFIAFILTALLVFRPRKSVPVAQRSLHVAETQILLSVVAASLMMIVGDSTARAFAIFAAVSLVRFRTNIKDPKEITVLLVSLALGLAAGVGRWDLGLILCGSVIIILWFLERAEPELDLRTLELTLKTTDPERTRAVAENVFSRTGVDAEFVELKGSGDRDKSSTVTYRLELKLSITTDRISRMILMKDGDAIESISWKTAKRSTDIFE